MVEELGAFPRSVTARGSFITSADVAVHAGVSRSAVSRAFTPGASVSPKVRQKVIAAADELGYRVNRLARGLISARSNLVGIICSNLDAPFAAGLLSATTSALLARGLHALVFEFDDQSDNIHTEIQRILEYRVEAIVVMSGSPSQAIFEECLANGVKLVMVDRPVIGHGSFNISSDDYGGASLAADRLMTSGHRCLAVVASDSETPSQVRRIAGFVDRARERGVEAHVTRNGRATYASGERGARALFEGASDARPDGVFCTSDLLAAGFMDVVRNDYGLRIPGDLSVIGYDDIPQAAWGAYQLTTLRQCPHHLGQAIVRAIRSDGPPEPSVTIGASLVERSSARALR